MGLPNDKEVFVTQKSLKKTKFEFSCFVDPPFEYRPVVFWSWNEVMQSDEISRQLRLMKEAGLGGGFIHSRIGLLTEYLGQEWFEVVLATIKESKKLGFKVYLYDEDKWPSGFAGGLVPLEKEAYRMKALVARPVDKKVPKDYTSIGVSTQNVQVYQWISPLGYDWFNGTCYSDLMSRDAMRYFIKQSYQAYYDRFGEYYGSDIVLEFTDEPSAIFRGRLPEGAVPYSDDLPEAFRKLHGYDPQSHFCKLFLDLDGAEQFRIHYFRTVNFLFENNFSKQISNWCSAHHIGLTGHYMFETEMYGQQLWGTKVMANYRHQHQPGIDHLGRQIDEIISAKQCQSVVNQFGKRRMLSELFGCSGQGVSFEDRLWIATQQIQLGVNFLNPHLSLYTMAGCRKRDFPPNLFYQQPWWEVNSAIDVPLARLCYIMSIGTFAADVLVIHPQESTFALWRSQYENCNDTLKSNNLTWDTQPVTTMAKEKIESLDKALKDLTLLLLNYQIQYDLGDETLIADEGLVEYENSQPVFKIGRMGYSTVILPSMHTISSETLVLLKKFQENGGLIYRCGEGPFVMDGEESTMLSTFLETVPSYDPVNLNRILQESNSVSFACEEGLPDHLWIHLRDWGKKTQLMLISNLTRSECFKGRITIKGLYRSVWLLNHWTGQREALNFECSGNTTVLDVALAPVESRVLIFEAVDSSQPDMLLREPRIEKTVELKLSEIKVYRLDDNALPLDTAKWAISDTPLSQEAVPLTVLQEMLNEKHYSGLVVLEYNFTVNKLSRDRHVRLVLEHPEYYRILVNQEECSYRGLKPWLDIRFMPIDITNKLVEGENIIRLECSQFHYGDKTNIKNNYARYGTEIEAIYIVGDFDIQAEFAESPYYNKSYWQQSGLEPELITLKKETAKLVEPGALQVNVLTASGLPFYAGKVEYRIQLPYISRKKEQSLYLSVEKLNAACAEIFIEEERIGYIISRPYQVDISEYYEPGKRLRIRLYSTLRNLLGPHHHPDGELMFNSPLSFLPQLEDGEKYTNIAINWPDGKIKQKKWDENYSLINFGDVGKINLKLYEKR